MDPVRILSIVCLVFLFGGYFLLQGKEHWSRRDHGRWPPDAVPSLGAQIVDVQFQEVQYSKNNAKFKTTVTFSDGYVFTTFATNREDTFLQYNISIDQELCLQIRENAMLAHSKAVRLEAERLSSRPAPVPREDRKPLPAWASWLLRPHHIVGVLGFGVAVWVNLTIPQEKLIWLTACLGLAFVEFFFLSLFHILWDIPGNVLVLFPFVLAVALTVIVPEAMSDLTLMYDCFRTFPFAAAWSATLIARRIWKYRGKDREAIGEMTKTRRKKL